MVRKLKSVRTSVLALIAGLLLAPAASAVELTMYYPVAVGGPLTKIVDGLVADFMKENPEIEVKAIYAGNYNDARIKALAALKSGQPAQLSVMFSIDIYELIEQDAIVAFDDIVETDEERAWLDSFYPSLMENGMTGARPGASRSSAPPSSCTTTRTPSAMPDSIPTIRRRPGRSWWRPGASWSAGAGTRSSAGA